QIDGWQYQPLRRRGERTGESQLREVESNARLIVGLGKAGPVQPRVDYHGRRNRVDVVHHTAPVDAVQQISESSGNAGAAKPVAAVFHTVIVAEVVEELVAVADVVIEPAQLTVKHVGAGARSVVILDAVFGARLIGGGIER